MITNNWKCLNKNKYSDFLSNTNNIKIACILAYYKGQKYIKDQIKSLGEHKIEINPYEGITEEISINVNKN